MSDVTLAQVRREWENACDCMYGIDWRSTNQLLASIHVIDYRVADDDATLTLRSRMPGAADRFMRQNKSAMALRITQALGFSGINVDRIEFDPEYTHQEGED